MTGEFEVSKNSKLAKVRKQKRKLDPVTRNNNVKWSFIMFEM